MHILDNTPELGPGGWWPPLPTNIASVFMLTEHDSPGAGLIGRMYFAVDQGADPGRAFSRLQSEARKLDFAVQALAYQSPTEQTPPTDPELVRR